jgi:hypothetical protein
VAGKGRGERGSIAMTGGRKRFSLQGKKKKRELKHSLKSAKSISGATGRRERDAMGLNRCAVDG